jgi:hypothetical protein
MKKILHFSPVKKQNDIVKLHLRSLSDLKIDGFDCMFSFFDDNDDDLSSIALKEFQANHEHTVLFTPEDIGLKKNDEKQKERWSLDSYKRITKIKNFAIEYFLKENYDYLFFTDSDLILHPETLNILLKQNKHFCSEIFWTKFNNTPTYAPNGWYSKSHGYTKEDLLMFKENGTYKVDFTGACTLLSKKILLDGVSFKRIPNLDFLGEDKHFCIRASVMNYDIYLNTSYPAFHLFDKNLIHQGNAFIESGYNLDYLKRWLNNEWEEKIIPWLYPKKKSFFRRLLNIKKN